MIQVRVRVSGRVQGVSYRASTYHEAMRYPGLKGYVQNLPDGSVEAVFAGDRLEVQAMVDWCRSGPRLAQVTEHQAVEEDFDPSLSPFQIRY